MTNHQTLKISGMLNQHEFAQRYLFTKQRIANGFSRHELAFLLGRSTYDIVDYEHLHGQMKMNFRDHDAMAVLFKIQGSQALEFNSKINDIDISNDKRIIRGTVTETEKAHHIHFIHPWKIKGENKPITVTECMERCTDKDLKIHQFVQNRLVDLKKIGHFEQGCTALFLYQQIDRTITAEWRPLFVTILRQIIYAYVHSNEFQIHSKDGQIFYKTKL